MKLTIPDLNLEPTHTWVCLSVWWSSYCVLQNEANYPGFEPRTYTYLGCVYLSGGHLTAYYKMKLTIPDLNLEPTHTWVCLSVWWSSYCVLQNEANYPGFEPRTYTYLGMFICLVVILLRTTK